LYKDKSKILIKLNHLLSFGCIILKRRASAVRIVAANASTRRPHLFIYSTGSECTRCDIIILSSVSYY